MDEIQRCVDESEGEFETVEEFIEFASQRSSEKTSPSRPISLRKRRRSRRGYED